jgi:predicted PhzF superfamily epimerase YddE/YHI9
LKIPAYHIDAFAGAVFSGNPAMVCPLDRWLDDGTLRLIARENSLPVTAFFVDAATGSTHCTLAPYWAKRLGKRKLHAIQLSQRRGELWCESLEDRVRISAKAVRYAEGFLSV